METHPAVLTQKACGERLECRLLGAKGEHLKPQEVLWLEVVGGAATPVHDVLVLAFAAQLTVPVGDPQVVVHKALTGGAILQHCVEEGLQTAEEGEG